MSKALSLKLSESIFEEVEKITKELNKPRNAYINEALLFYNRFMKRKRIRELLKKESSLIKSDSLMVLSEFEEMEDEIFE
ncbi:MAG: hypothetical protein APR63_06635 [Desulfuromonas sp. SDB]|nr:MAG: hypothetical protein APR63_06635 [Desulfuromonas sp. SDB]